MTKIPGNDRLGSNFWSFGEKFQILSHFSSNLKFRVKYAQISYFESDGVKFKTLSHFGLNLKFHILNWNLTPNDPKFQILLHMTKNLKFFPRLQENVIKIVKNTNVDKKITSSEKKFLTVCHVTWLSWNFSSGLKQSLLWNAFHKYEIENWEFC